MNFCTVYTERMYTIAQSILRSDCRIVVVDTLSYINAFERRLSIPESIERLQEKHGPSLIILVTKKQNVSPNFAEITRNYSNCIIVECNDDVFIAQNKKARPEDRVDWESEADDHMVQVIEKIIAITGCAPFHEGIDQYKNAREIAKYMPSYPYHTYMQGNKESCIMNSANEWIKRIVLYIMINGPRKQQCTPGKIGFCRSSGHVGNPCCTRCGICIECRWKINKKQETILRQQPKSEEHWRLRRPSRCSDVERKESEQMNCSAVLFPL